MPQPHESNKKQNTKQFSIIDETVKTTDKIVKRKPKSKYPGLRKQLQNDEILKNYFVLDNKKDHLTTFRIEKGIQFGQNIVTQQVRVVSESNNSQEDFGQEEETNQSHVQNQIQNQILQLSNSNQPMNNEENMLNQHELNILLIQLFSLLIQHQQEY